MLKWFIGLYDRNGKQDNNLVIGSRVRTSVGRGVITGGCVHVRYDNPIKGQHAHDRSVTHNLSAIELED